jgi:hypothetical protein
VSCTDPRSNSSWYADGPSSFKKPGLTSSYLAACLALPADDDSSCRLGKISRRCPKRVLGGEQAPARCSTVVGGAGWLLGIEIVSASKIEAEVFYEEKVE